ncbi:hypothetical protein TNCV_3393841 [Trichonephila clavipes]|nr:hypothetical protein TNCV_3393841 [Trichonephila clavipes]
MTKLRKEAERRRRRLNRFCRRFKAWSGGGKAAPVKPDTTREVKHISSKEQRRNDQESRFSSFRKNSASPGGSQSGLEESHLVGQDLTPSIIIDSPENKISKSLRRL